ncbi:ribose-5-phosphate isomerase [Robiginitalea myxolifaciens]|uniref:Ribose-5-phosphate isomerase A n=1 Tax=Robiginitalea myxolifaciens TaxID=400055 RepID=A0A1I6GBR9_9FLAO|nr:ribose-5-phosphate isomerase RpiA [Robiginitalea myxolifaciens]SFR39632.1 ribose-5-phosphate isomerase [Robiginitalea myxolifaciens]
MDHTTQAKQQAAKAALKYVEPGMILGLGTGSTAAELIRLLGEQVAQGFDITGVPSSDQSAQLAQELGIPLSSLQESPVLDLNIDGADEVDPQFNMIKGGGGALLREKILAQSAKRNIFIVDQGKQVHELGAFPLPLEVVPFALESVVIQLQQIDLNPQLRLQNGAPFKTDEGNAILDADIRGFSDYQRLNSRLLAIPGIVETGLFLDYVDVLIVGNLTGAGILENPK